MFSFPKQERLCSKKRIDALYRNSKGFLLWPLSVRYLIRDDAEDSTPSVLIVCPKRYHHHATERNRMKRLMREAWRLNSISLKETLASSHKGIDIAISFVNKEMSDFSFIENLMKQVLTRIENEVKADNGNS